MVRVVIRCHNDCISEVFNNLGKNVCILDNHDGTFLLSDDVILSKKFIRWILGFGASTEVMQPDSFCNDEAGVLKVRVESIYEQNNVQEL